jgi:hypothetical protein
MVWILSVLEVATMLVSFLKRAFKSSIRPADAVDGMKVEVAAMHEIRKALALRAEVPLEYEDRRIANPWLVCLVFLAISHSGHCKTIHGGEAWICLSIGRDAKMPIFSDEIGIMPEIWLISYVFRKARIGGSSSPV